MKDEREKVTKEEFERAFQELAVFLFELYRKDKQLKVMEQESIN